MAEPGCPVVALVTTTAGSVALLVASGDDSTAPTFEAIWAPELTTAVLNGLLTTSRDGQVVGGYLAGQLGDQDALGAALADGLPVVGTSLIGPVAARLRELGAGGVVLLPTGLLGLLPLHAAPYVVDGETRCLLDEFDVSHTPGALVLRAARAALAARETRPAVLVGVGNPQPHPQPLAFARAELEEVARFFPDDASHPLYETAATEPALVDLLPGLPTSTSPVTAGSMPTRRSIRVSSWPGPIRPCPTPTRAGCGSRRSWPATGSATPGSSCCPPARPRSPMPAACRTRRSGCRLGCSRPGCPR